MDAAPDSPPSQSPRRGMPSAVVIGGLVRSWPWILVCAVTFSLLSTALSGHLLGPLSNNDGRLMRAALSHKFDAKLYFSYVHVWSLKALLYGFPDRRLAGALLGGFSSAGLILATFGLTRHLLGTAWGLLSAALMVTFSPLLTQLTVPSPFSASAAYGTLALWATLVVTGEFAKSDGSAPFNRNPQTRKQQFGAALAGLLCFASLRTHIIGLAIVPVVLLCFASRAKPSYADRARADAGWLRNKRLLWLLLGGFLVGALVLSLLEAAALADPIASFRPRNLSGVARYLRGGPFRPMWRLHPFRSPFILALEQHGVREWAIAGMLGLVLAYRSQSHELGKRTLALWVILTLPLLAWFYPNEDPGELNFATTLCLAPGLAIGLTLFIRKLWVQPGPTAEEFPLALALVITMIASAITITGLYAELAILSDASKNLPRNFATERSALFFFTIAIPVSAGAAAVLRPRWLRTVPMALTTCALLLSGARSAQTLVDRHLEVNRRWSTVARAAFPPHLPLDAIPHIAVLHGAGKGGSIPLTTIQNHLTAISPRPVQRFAVRRVLSSDEVKPGELLIIDRGPEMTAVHGNNLKAPASYRYVTNLKGTRHVVQVFAPPARTDD